MKAPFEKDCLHRAFVNPVAFWKFVRELGCRIEFDETRRHVCVLEVEPFGKVLVVAHSDVRKSDAQTDATSSLPITRLAQTLTTFPKNIVTPVVVS